MKEPTDDELFGRETKNRTEPRFQAGDLARRVLYYPVRYFFLGLYFIWNMVIGFFLALGIFILWLYGLLHGDNI